MRVRLAGVALAAPLLAVLGMFPGSVAAGALVAEGGDPPKDPPEGPISPASPDLVSVGARHDRRRGVVVVTMRFRAPLQASYPTHTAPLLQWTLWRAAGRCVGERPRPGNLHVEAHHVSTLGPGASYYIESDPFERRRELFEYSRARLRLSRDRLFVRVRLSNDYLRGRTYVLECASVTAKFDPSGFGPDSLLDEAEAFFELPLERLRARVGTDRGQLTVHSVSSARGARVAIRILRRGRLVVRRALLQPVGRSRILEPLALPCRVGALYQVRIRARDRYGNRRLLVLDRRCR